MPANLEDAYQTVSNTIELTVFKRLPECSQSRTESNRAELRHSHKYLCQIESLNGVHRVKIDCQYLVTRRRTVSRRQYL